MSRFGIPALLAAILYTSSSAGASELDTVSAYAGSWATHTVHYKTKYSKARVESAMLRNNCWRSAQYFACDQFVDGVSKALIVFTYDRPHDLYHTYTVPTDGSAAGNGTLRISGTTWTYPWREKDGTQTVYFHVVNNFTDPKTIAYRQEFSTDGKHWTVVSSGTERRL